MKRSPPVEDSNVEALVAEGKYAEAARVALENDDPRQAATLYARVWEFAKASQCARQAGDLKWALENALLAHDEALVSELQQELIASGEAGHRSAMELLAKHRYFRQAAQFAEELGELELAIEYFRNAHSEPEAARLLVALDRDHEAGLLLEDVIKLGGDPAAVASAKLQLGHILARRLQHEEAARLFQSAADHEETRLRAHCALVVELAALGYRIAARDVLTQICQQDDSVSSDLDAFLRNHHQPQRKKRPKITVLAGRYRLERKLGAGGAGQVYLARDEVTDRDIAIKLFSTVEASSDPIYERFKREIRIASALHHPNIVEVYDYSTESGFLVMEYMAGGSLADRIQTGPVLRAVDRLALDLLEGLAFAHRRGIIHRDVKPANIFYNKRGTVKLGDFGIAHLLDLGQTQTGGMMGTLAYMAPEQITGARLSVSTDLYGLGITLYETLTGHLPFLGPDFVAQHLGETPRPLSSHSESLKKWDPIISRLLQKNPSDRYQTIRELRGEIQEIRQKKAPKPLILPRAKPSTAQALAKPSVPAKAAASSEFIEQGQGESARYQFETSLGRTPISTLSRAVDTVLNRTVVLERYTKPVDETTEQRIYSLARGGGPFLQRTLAYDQALAIAVREAPAGVPVLEAFSETAIDAPKALHLLRCLALGLYPMHRSGVAHGRIDETAIVVDEFHNPTILVTGLSQRSQSSPADDVNAIVSHIATLLGTAPAELAHKLTGKTSAPPLAQPATATELHAWVLAIER